MEKKHGLFDESLAILVQVGGLGYCASPPNHQLINHSTTKELLAELFRKWNMTHIYIYKPLSNLRDEPPNRWAMAHRLVRPCKVDSQLWCSCGMGDWMFPHCLQKRTNVLFFGRKGGATFTLSILEDAGESVDLLQICSQILHLQHFQQPLNPAWHMHSLIFSSPFPPKAPGLPTSFAWSESGGWPPTVLVEHPSSHLHSYPAAAARAQPLRSWCHRCLEAVPNLPWLFGAWKKNTSTSSEVGGCAGFLFASFGVGGANQNKLLRITYLFLLWNQSIRWQIYQGFQCLPLSFFSPNHVGTWRGWSRPQSRVLWRHKQLLPPVFPNHCPHQRSFHDPRKPPERGWRNLNHKQLRMQTCKTSKTMTLKKKYIKQALV